MSPVVTAVPGAPTAMNSARYHPVVVVNEGLFQVSSDTSANADSPHTVRVRAVARRAQVAMTSPPRTPPIAWTPRRSPTTESPAWRERRTNSTNRTRNRPWATDPTNAITAAEVSVVERRTALQPAATASTRPADGLG